MDANIVGQGSYGCVVKPSLKCEKSYNALDSKPNYDNKVSKIMSDRDAKEEQQEMKIFKSIKGIEKYTVAYPKLCKPRMNEQFKKLVAKCRSSPVRQKQAERNLEGLSLLILEDGGVDLHQFVRSVFPTLSISDKEAFLVSIVDLVEGIEFFVEHNVLHHDIKLANIVYNIQTGKAKYIDFGMMEKIDNFIYEASDNNNEMAISWDYFPSELSCANRDAYEYDRKCNKYKKIPYREFINKVATSFDGYSLSLALVELFQHISNENTYNRPFLTDAIRLTQQYVKKNLATRNTDFAELRKGYKKLLEKYKIDSREPSPTKENIELAATLSVTSLNHSKPRCPRGKPDYNPITKKCVVACKDGKERNNKFRCVKTKKQTSSNRKTKKNTKSGCKTKGKDLNPKTGRCVNPCKQGQKRNAEFRCVSGKNEKV